MDVTTTLAVLISKRQFIKSQSDPLRDQIAVLNKQIALMESGLVDIDQQIAALVEVVDLGLDKG